MSLNGLPHGLCWETKHFAKILQSLPPGRINASHGDQVWNKRQSDQAKRSRRLVCEVSTIKCVQTVVVERAGIQIFVARLLKPASVSADCELS
jgi:hypothetical protein